MKQKCKKCGKPFRDGDRIKAEVLSVYHEISSSVTYAIEKPYECISMEHVDCESDEDSSPSSHSNKSEN